MQANATDANGTNSTNGTDGANSTDPLVFVEGHDPISSPIDVTKRKAPDAPPCLEAYESCEKSGTSLNTYEDYHFKNRTLGTFCAFFAFIPTFFFWILIWPWDSHKMRTLFMQDHAVYFYTWMSGWISHLLLFGPVTYAWLVLTLQGDDWNPDDIEFYKSMLLDVAVALGPPTWLLLVLSLLVVMYQDYNRQDDFYSTAQPFALTLFLSTAGLATTFILYEYNFEARMYYDKDARALYLEQKKLQEELEKNQITEAQFEE